MSNEPNFSFTFDDQAAKVQFKGIAVTNLVLAMLAGVTPERSWDGCLVYEGPAPDAAAGTVCIATIGPGAMEIQEKLVEAFEARNVPVLQLYEGGPEIRTSIALVLEGRWVEP